mmetsp:Transcript_1292/g.3611  ORF Transcript_1292/g.3611 Transcript_1292/m.3611 type:complete len:327 (-) Transcript_1292:259-1239(-)
MILPKQPLSFGCFMTIILFSELWMVRAWQPTRRIAQHISSCRSRPTLLAIHHGPRQTALFSSSTTSSSSSNSMPHNDDNNDDNNSPTVPPLDPTHKRLFLVRHGEVINPGGDQPVFYGALDVPLSKLGEQEAAAAGDWLQPFALSQVACSPLKRAVFGAQKVLERQDHLLRDEYELQVYEGFQELDRGAWCGKTKADIGADNLARFDACDESITPVTADGSGGESYPQLYERVLADLEALLQSLRPHQSAALVSHLQVTRCLVAHATQTPLPRMVKDISIATASITCIDYKEETSTDEKMGHEPVAVHFQSFKPQVGLAAAQDGAN